MKLSFKSLDVDEILVKWTLAIYGGTTFGFFWFCPQGAEFILRPKRKNGP